MSDIETTDPGGIARRERNLCNPFRVGPGSQRALLGAAGKQEGKTTLECRHLQCAENLWLWRSACLVFKASYLSVDAAELSTRILARLA
jgi:hypothetical protein